MLVKKRTGTEIPSSEITPKHLYLSRRQFMKAAAAGAATFTASALLASCGPGEPTTEATPGQVRVTADDLGDPLTEYQSVINYKSTWMRHYSMWVLADQAQRKARSKS